MRAVDSQRRWGLLALGLSLVLAGCGGGPSKPTETTSISPVQSSSSASSSSVSTTSIGTNGLRYVGPFDPGTGAPAGTIDLSLYYGLPRAAWAGGARRPSAVYDVTGGYEVRPNGFAGTITGTLDGSPDDGAFTGVLTANLSDGCVARRNYSGRLTREALNWNPGADIENCGNRSPLTVSIAPPASTLPPSTTISSSSTSSTSTTPPGATTTTTTLSSTTSTVPTSTTTTRPTTVTTTIMPPPTTISTTTSVLPPPSSTSTTTSTTTSTVPPPAVSVVYNPSPVPVGMVNCSGQPSAIPWWIVNIVLTNQSTGPISLSSHTTTFEPSGYPSYEQQNALVNYLNIPPGGTYQVGMCVPATFPWTREGGRLFDTFVFTTGGSYTSNGVTLSPY